MSDISDAKHLAIKRRAHYYVLNFPTGNKTFVYDVNTQIWHEKTERQYARRLSDCNHTCYGSDRNNPFYDCFITDGTSAYVGEFSANITNTAETPLPEH